MSLGSVTMGHCVAWNGDGNDLWGQEVENKRTYIIQMKGKFAIFTLIDN